MPFYLFVVDLALYESLKTLYCCGSMQIIFTLIGCAILFYWIHFFWVAHQFDSMLKKFSTSEKFNGSWPKVSIVVPARNEGRNIEASLHALQRQTYENLEVILVNDRSNDQTGTIMDTYARNSKDWRYIHIQTLSDGWLGKNNALHQGALAASGEYIVFTDGDIFFSPNAVEKTMQVVLTHHLDHLVLSATLKGKGFLLHAMQSFFALGMINILKLHKLGKSPRYYIGAGVFNLVKTSLYRSFGGHEPIRLEVIDDLMLGKIMVQHGAKPGFMDGRELVAVEWYPTWKEMIVGLEKNSFAALRYSIPRLLFLLLGMYGVYLFPYVGVFLSHGVPPLLFASSLVISHLVFAMVCKRMGHSILASLLLPVAVIVVGFAFLRSAFLITMRGRIVWRETSYPLKLLRQVTKL